MGRNSAEYSREWKRKRREERAAKGQCIQCDAPPVGGTRRCQEHRDQVKANSARWYFQLKVDALSHYGGQLCACCGESIIKFLTIDHIDGNGAEHRRQDPTAITLYRWLKRHDYPDGFRVLCFNCNCGRFSNNGICPHKTA